MEITGKLIEILEVQTGKSAKGEWKKQEFIIETEEQYPKKICIANWNDKVDINSIKKGDTLTASVNIESREFNGRWYTDIKIWRLESGSTGENGNMNSDLGAPMPPPPSEQDMNWENNDEVNDLPF